MELVESADMMQYYYCIVDRDGYQEFCEKIPNTLPLPNYCGLSLGKKGHQVTSMQVKGYINERQL